MKKIIAIIEKASDGGYGLAFASAEQREKIESGIHSISEKLSMVQF